jgi:hypothetical protein
MHWSAVKCNAVQWSGVQQSGVQRSVSVSEPLSLSTHMLFEPNEDEEKRRKNKHAYTT